MTTSSTDSRAARLRSSAYPQFHCMWQTPDFSGFLQIKLVFRRLCSLWLMFRTVHRMVQPIDRHSHGYPSKLAMTGLPYDVRGLIGRLGSTLRGTATGDPGVRALYCADASNYRVVPDLVVVPADVDDLVAAVMLISQAGAPIVLRGAGTSMAGNAIGGGVLDVSRHLNTIVDIDPAARTAVVEPGVVLTDLTGAAAAYGLTFGADLSSATRATRMAGRAAWLRAQAEKARSTEPCRPSWPGTPC